MSAAAGRDADPRREDSPDRAARALRRRKFAMMMQGFITASYLVEFTCLMLLAAAGAVAYHVPVTYLLLFMACSAVSITAQLVAPPGYFADPFLTLPQMLCTASIQIGFMLWVPEVGIPMLTGLFLVVGFAGLRLNLREACIAALLLAGGAGAAIWLHGHELSIPLETPLQQLVSSLWISTVLARAIMLGQYGAQLRKVLLQRNNALNQAVEVAERGASRDVLTGSLNRGSILKAIEAERQRMLRNGRPFSLALLDLDYFKRINDGFGHLAGDEVLTVVVAQIAAQLRATDVFGRYGGEEFLVLLVDSTSHAEAGQVLARVLHAVRDYRWHNVAPGLSVTTSAGLAVARPDETVSQLIGRADDALYRAKNAGRDRICVG